MDRRQFIHMTFAIGSGAALPALAMSPASAHLVRGRPRFGVVTVGGIARGVLTDCMPNLPFRPRTIAINTDARGFVGLDADHKIMIGDGEMRPKGFADAARLAGPVLNDIANAVAGIDMVFLSAGMGGATGTLISPVVAMVLRAQGIPIMAYTVYPFAWEGRPKRHRLARSGVSVLRPRVDALITACNEKFGRIAGEEALGSSVLQLAPKEFWQRYRRTTDVVIAQSASQEWGATVRDARATWLGLTLRASESIPVRDAAWPEPAQT